MCGIFGMVLQDGALSRERRTVGATLLAAFNEQRGDDSWGMAAWKQGKPQMKHGMYSPVDGALFMAAQTAWIGHARFATVGEKTLQNSHPFKFGNIIGAHNGGIYNHKELAAKYERKCEVDSMHIFAHLAEGRDTEELEGYGAIEFLHAEAPDSVFLCQMRNGDLCILGIGKGPETARGVLWSSDSTHARDVARAIGLDAFAYKIKEGHVYRAARDGLYETPQRVKLKAYTTTVSRCEPYTWTGGDWSDAAKGAKRKKYKYRATGFYGGAGDDKDGKVHYLGNGPVHAGGYDHDSEDTPLLIETAGLEEAEYLEWCDDMTTGCNQWVDPEDPDVRKAYLDWKAQKHG